MKRAYWQWSKHDQREATAIILDTAKIACEGFDLRIWRKPRGMNFVQLADATCISVKSRRKCMACRARLLAIRITQNYQ